MVSDQDSIAVVIIVAWLMVLLIVLLIVVVVSRGKRRSCSWLRAWSRRGSERVVLGFERGVLEG